MRQIYLSPHFDDAVLSCGGLIFEQTRQGTPVEIWTVCAGEAPPGELSPLAQFCHYQWGTESAAQMVPLRVGEDRHAAELLGAGTHHFDIPDCIYRRNPAGDLLYTQTVFSDRDPSEENLHLGITASLKKELLPDDLLVCPLAIGGHLDHRLARQAAEGLGVPLTYYADFPYLINHPDALPGAFNGLIDTFYPVSEQGLHAWEQGIAAYKSQLASLFETEEKMKAAIHAYWAERGGLRLWRV